MADKRRIAVFTASRAERGLLEPIITRIRNHPDLMLHEEEISPFYSLAFLTEQAENLSPCDIALIPTDRREMVPVAMCCFYNNIPTFHFLGGACTFSHTHDDVARHVISMFSHYVFAEDPQAKSRLVRMGFEEKRIIVSGTTHFDDVIIDETLCPKEPYDLFLMNPTTLDYPFFDTTLQKSLDILRDPVVFIGPNEDTGAKLIDFRIKQYCRDNHHSRYFETVPRPQFLGLLKNCRQFVSNSSSTIYEAPYFDVPVINYSVRNAYRTKPNPKYLKGGADKVVNTLATIDLSDKSKVLNKRFPNWPWVWRDLGLHTS